MAKSAILLLAFSTAILSAAPVISPATVTPTSAPTNIATTITITAAITDSSLVPGSVNLHALNQTGDATSVEGSLHDDGKNGDATSGDKIFTIVFTRTQPTPGPLSFRVSAAFGGILERVFSITLTVNFGTGAAPVISDFNPKTGPIGTLVTVTGTNLAPAAGSSAQVSMSKQGGGLIPAPVASTTATELNFTVPAGAATGPVAITVNNASATTTAPFTVTASSNFTISVAPTTVDLIQGQTAVYAVTLASTSGFSQLASLSVTGLPPGVTASFKPQLLAIGGTSVLTVTAPSNQAPSQSTLTVAANANVDGIALSQTAQAGLRIVAQTTSFIGRTVVSDALQTPLAGVTVKMLGTNGTVGTTGITGCAGQTVSDAAGNFALTNLPANCIGSQLVGYNGLTAVSPPGKYAGVNIVYTLTRGQVTKSPVLVHLPRIDDRETFNVVQNSSTTQTYPFRTIPGLSVTVYPGTTFTQQDGTRPNPFPLVAVQVPVDRLPDYKAPVPTMVSAFIVAFQPANAVASQPVAVYYPNTLNTPPSVSMTMMTLDPTLGRMVPYGTATVSADGTQIVPDPDSRFTGRRYGIVNFDWHGPMPPGPPANPAPPGGCPLPPKTANPIDLASGIEVITATDISIAGGRGTILIERTYRTLSNEVGPFGIGTNHNYGYRLDTAAPENAVVINLIFPDGNRFPFAKGASGTFTNSTIPILRGSVMTAPASGPVALRWKNGTTWRFVRSTFQLGSLLDSITDSNNNVISLRRNSSRPLQIAEVVDPVGRKLVLTHDPSDRITVITDPIGRIVRYAYNTQGTLASVTDPEGGVTRYEYDSQNRLTRVTDARGVLVAQNSYDANGRVIQQVQADGGIIRFAYTLTNPLIPTSPVQETRVTDALGRTETYRFNLQGMLTDVRDALGQPRIFERELGTNQLVVIRGAGSCISCDRAAAGDQFFSYDASGNVLTVTDALGKSTSYTYEPAFSKVSSITYPVPGQATRITYDSSGNLLVRTDENGNATRFGYNTFGLLTELVNPLSHRTTFSHDAAANLVAVTDPLGNTRSFNFDGVSRRIETVDALGRQTKTAYDRLGRITGVTDADGFQTLHQYDPVGNLVSVTDARGLTTTFTYDAMNRLRTRTDSRGRSDTRTYDLVGNSTGYTDRRGQNASFAYDSLNRLTSEVYQDSTVNRYYDANSRLARGDDSLSGSTGYSYDLVNRLVGSTGPSGTITYIRDERGRVRQRSVAGQPSVMYGYDSVGNMITAFSAQAAVTVTYDGQNQRAGVLRSNGVASVYGYDAAGHLVALTHSRGATVIDSQAYTYDAAGNRIGRTSSIAQPLITQSSNYQYDAGSNQLLQRGTSAYTHDEGGNRLTESGPSGATIYTWDSRNRLRSILAPTDSTVFSYDFEGNLIGQVDRSGSGDRSQQFLVDSLTNVVYQTDSAGQRLALLTGQALDEHFAVITSGGQVEFGLDDAVNSTVGTADQAGLLVSQPFGETSSGATTYGFLYTGRTRARRDLFYLRARFYDSKAGRFVSEDPLGLNGGDVNLYRYVKNNPVRFSDPRGLGLGCTLTCLLACAALDLPLACSGVGLPITVPIGVACELLCHDIICPDDAEGKRP